MQKMRVLSINNYKKMRISIGSIYKKMRITIVFKQLFIFIFLVFRRNETQYNKERPPTVVSRKDRK